jgi:hypothetical protein
LNWAIKISKIKNLLKSDRKWGIDLHPDII